MAAVTAANLFRKALRNNGLRDLFIPARHSVCRVWALTAREQATSP